MGDASHGRAVRLAHRPGWKGSRTEYKSYPSDETVRSLTMNSKSAVMMFAAFFLVANVANAVRGQNSAAVLTNPASAPNAIKILFIGNSFVYVNNLPGILTSLGNSPGSPHQIQTTYVTIGGANLDKLWYSSPARETIQGTKWDYVVLQEATVTLQNDPAAMAKSVRMFDAEIKKSGAKSILFLPWARKQHRQAQPAMNESTYQIAKELGAQVAPIGPAWTIVQGLKADIGLYQADLLHATPTGSCLAACTIYLMLMHNQESCSAIEHGDISQDDLTVIRKAAIEALESAP